VSVTGTCFEKYIHESAVLAEKRLRQQCKSVRRMVRLIRKGKGDHLISVAKPHMADCVRCQRWAESRGYDMKTLFWRPDC
jgi:hypothetical protein